MSLDKYTMGYRWVMGELRAQPEIADGLEFGNIIDVVSTANRSPLKDSYGTGDLPELMVVPAGFATNFAMSSSTIEVALSLDLGFKTDDIRAHLELLPYMFAIHRAVALMVHKISWPGPEVVPDLKAVTSQGGTVSDLRSQGIEREGWASGAEIQLVYRFDKGDMIGGL